MCRHLLSCARFFFHLLGRLLADSFIASARSFIRSSIIFGCWLVRFVVSSVCLAVCLFIRLFHLSFRPCSQSFVYALIHKGDQSPCLNAYDCNAIGKVLFSPISPLLFAQEISTCRFNYMIKITIGTLKHCLNGYYERHNLTCLNL